jgi:hypothetical protein
MFSTFCDSQNTYFSQVRTIVLLYDALVRRRERTGAKAFLARTLIACVYARDLDVELRPRTSRAGGFLRNSSKVSPALRNRAARLKCF